MGNVAAVPSASPDVTPKPTSDVPSARYDRLSKDATPTETYIAIILDFFDGINLVNHNAPDRPQNDVLIKTIQEELNHHLSTSFITPTDYKLLMRILPHASSFASVPFSTIPLDVQIFIGRFTMYFIYVDDQVDTDPAGIIPHLHRFPHLLSATLPESELALTNPVLRLAATNLRFNTSRFFGGYNTGVLLKGSIDYTMGCIIEALNNIRTASSQPLVGEQYEPRDELRMLAKYTKFLRLKTALSEGFSTFLFPKSQFPDEAALLPDVIPIVPVLVDFIDHVNDILSYYKEILVGDEKTYFAILERVSGEDKIVLLKRECDNQVRLVRGVRRLLEGKEELLRHFDGFVEGYVRWHNDCGRYRMGEIGIGAYGVPGVGALKQ